MIKISDINLWGEQPSQGELSTLLHQFNDTSCVFPAHTMIHELFEEQAMMHPESVALRDETAVMTYGELQQYSGKIATFLNRNGLSKESIVVLLLDNNVHLIAAMLGVLKAGGAYLPLSPSDPYERVKYMINDAAATVMVTEKKYLTKVNSLQWECRELSTYLCLDSSDLYKEPEDGNELMQEKLWDYIAETAHDDISGGAWFSSYTGEDISRAEMDEYAKNIKHKLAPYLGPETRVLEIGCSSGITLLELCPTVKHYVGTDLSAKMISGLEKEVEQRSHKNVRLLRLPAHQIDELHAGKFDVIILNSVIQCFSGLNYLRDVLDKAVSLLDDKGVIFLGDVQDVELKDEFLFSISSQIARSGNKVKTDWSNELFISKEFLEDLRHEIPAIRSIAHSDKIATLENELTRYRFDSILQIDKSCAFSEKASKRHKFQWDAAVFDDVAPGSYAKNLASQLAYVIYTSGSTGVPKGCMVTHENVVRLMKNDRHPFDFNDQDVWIMSHPSNFDFSVWEIYGALLYGGQLVIPARDHVKDVQALYDTVRNQNVTVFNQTPLAFKYFIETALSQLSGLTALRYIIFGGDKLEPTQLKPWVNRYPVEQVKLINMYGITETTVHVSFHEISLSDINTPDHSNVGRPLPETTVYFLDENRKRIPVEALGEVFVGGTGVCRGYLNQPELTHDRFVFEPSVCSTRLYKSGDIGRMQKTGGFEIIGRSDDQVKIRGYRIEISEIKRAIASFPNVEDVAVITAQSNPGESEIIAYVMTRASLDGAELKRFLSSHISDFMIPTFIIFVDSFPLTASGKLNKKLLPSPFSRREPTANFVPPETQHEVLMAEIWKALLGLTSVSATDNFFDVGGHSLKGTKLISRIAKAFNVQLELRDLFLNPTLKALARVAEKKQKVDFAYLPKTPEQEYYEVSHAQQRMWILSQWEENQYAYNMPQAYHIAGVVSIPTLERALTKLIERHETLRTIFIPIDEVPKQRVVPAHRLGFGLEIIDLLGDPDQDNRIYEISKEAACAPFDLGKGPLLRVKLVIKEPRSFVLLITLHHIISDGWSTGIFIRELVALYRAYLNGRPEPLEPLRIQYHDFVAWQHTQLQRSAVGSMKAYWLNHLKGDLPVLDLVTDFARPAVKTFRGDRVSIGLNKVATETLRGLSRENNASLFMLLLASVNVLLHKYTNQEDIIVGVPVAGRDHVDLENQIGFFINTLPLRTQVTGKSTVKEVIERVKEACVNGYANQHYPFDRMVDDLQVERNINRSPVFDIVVQLLDSEFQQSKSDEALDLDVSSHPLEFQISKFDLDFTFQESPEDIFLTIEYNVDLFTRQRIERMMHHYQHLVSMLPGKVDAPIAELSLLPYPERWQLMEQSINGRSNSQETIVTLFEGQVQKNPNAVALCSNSIEYTYHELNQRANRLAHYLKEDLGIYAEELLAVMVNRSVEMVAAYLGILKAGGAYLPIDVDQPIERIKLLLRESGVNNVLSGAALKDKLADLPISLTIVEEIEWKDVAPDNLGATHHFGSLAYLMFTSGSTGVPKGVLVEHQSVVNLIKDVDYVPLSCHTKLLQTGAVSFDASIFEIWGTLLNGGRLFLVDNNELLDFSMLKNRLAEYQINTIWLTAPLFNLIVDTDSSVLQTVDTIVVGGDRLSPSHINGFLKKYPKIKLVNGYGPTENTTFSTSFAITETQTADIPIGKPIDGRSAVVLDSDRNLVPHSVVGELLVGGPGVARGYLNEPELTHERFVKEVVPFGRLYRTGDLGYVDQAGNLRCLGRADDQIKIRGFRVEPSEIDNVLKSHPAIKEAKTVSYEKDGVRFLATYYTCQGGTDDNELRSSLEQQLPAYLIPAHLVQLVAMPLTSHGKIAVHKLPPIEISFGTDQACKEPETNTQEILRSLWSLILKRTPIGTNDNFFRLGGNSLLATQLISRISKQWMVRITLRDFFMNPTIEALADFIQSANTMNYEQVTPGPLLETYPATHAQKRLWGTHYLQADPHAYNICSAYAINGQFDIETLNAVMTSLIDRHESLRTTFEFLDGEIRQRIAPATTTFSPVSYLDLQDQANPLDVASRLAEQESTFVFDLKEGPLYRVKLLRLADERFILLFTIHHIICDAWSLEVLVNDFFERYLNLSRGLAPNDSQAKLHYRDYALWQEKLLTNDGDYALAARQFWQQQLAGPLQTLDFPTDGLIRERKGGQVSITLDGAAISAMQEAAARENASMFMFLLATVSALLNKYTGKTDILIASPVAGRVHADLENVLGLFTNTILFRTKPNDACRFLDLLKQVRETTLAAFNFQLYPFDRIIGETELRKHQAEMPVDVMMQYLKMDLERRPGPGETDRKFEIEYFSSKIFQPSFVPLYFTFIESNNRLQINIVYDIGLFSKKAVETIASRLENIIETVSRNAELKIDALLSEQIVVQDVAKETSFGDQFNLNF